MVVTTTIVARQKLDIGSAKNMTYSAQGVHLTQTDDQGNLYIRAEVRQLEQDMQQNIKVGST